jgi:hypothetical protein
MKAFEVGWNPGQFRAVLVLVETVGGGSDGSRFWMDIDPCISEIMRQAASR